MKKLIFCGFLLAMTAPVFAAPTNLPAFVGGVQSNVIWKMPKAVKMQCSAASSPQNYMTCVGNAMQKDKASPQAIAIMQFTRGEVSDYKKFGDLAVLKVSVPAADHDQELYIVNKNGDIMDVDDHAILSSIDITKAKNYQALARPYPNISIWPGNHGYPINVSLPGGIQQLQFAYSLLNGCHACELGGIANVGFNFDSDGRFIGAQLLSLDPPPVVSSNT